MSALGGLRVLALVLLTSLCLFLVFTPTAQTLRHAVFDTYQRLFPLERLESPVTIVLIDENSIARYGQWPWPRTRMAELVEAIAKHKPLAIGLDLVFPEPDRFSPGALAAELPIIPSSIARILETLPSNDFRFGEALRGHNVVLGISAENNTDPRFARPPVAAPVVLAGEVSNTLRKYPGHIGSVPAIDAAGASRGILNSGPQDQVVRQVPLAANVQGSIVPALGVETLRLAAAAGMRLESKGNGLIEMRFDRVRTTLQDDGNQWLRFTPRDTDNSVPAALVMAGEAKPESLHNKIVLVGVSGLGVQDYKTTPLREFVPGVNIHAQVVENLFNDVYLVRPENAPWLEAAALLACGFILIWFVPRLSALQGINLVTALVIVLFGTGIVGFLHFHVLFDPAWPAIGTVAVFITVVVATLSQSEKQRRVLRDQAARMAGEVDAARRIQMGLLPDPNETLGNDPRFKLAAQLEPARTVGGDFYDCFMIDERRLFFAIADVSGKGLPAALFMASVKSHLKSAALRGGAVGEVLSRAQDEIARENPEQLFVTAFAARLDVATGELEYANAGHEPPFARTPSGAPERFGSAGGPPLCVLEEFSYPTEGRRLVPGEWLFLVTDGATEAMNPKREFFGVERLRTALAWLPDGVSPGEVLQRMRDDVARFAAGAELADDITLLALRWEGPT